MTDAIELLRRDHDEIRRLLTALETTPARTDGKPRHDPRCALAEQLVMAESGHEAIEEEYFWPLVSRRVHNGARLAEEGLSQEQELTRVLDTLEKHGPGHREFETLIRQFTAIGRAHIDFEETQVWPAVRLALSEQELDELGAQLEQGKRLAPTRPHPRMSSDPETLKVAAPIAGATDRIRDVLGGRHHPEART
jgi:hemerythrin-like domain-containing protein